MTHLEFQTKSYWNVDMKNAVNLVINKEIDEVTFTFPCCHEIITQKEMGHVVGLMYDDYSKVLTRTLSKTKDGYQLNFKRKMVD